tara:strand:- start:308 stop:1429 length:1122 start_codon:yes stop_codon:yes gene_type:complete
MKKIAIIGAGNAGCISALHFYNYANDKYDIEIYHSPGEHPIERVGQGTTVTPSALISSVLDSTWYNNPIGATFKTGFLYEGWGKFKDELFHPFPMTNMALHYVPKKLSNAVLESGLFKVNQQIINDPEKEIDADMIIDCRGRHNRDKDEYDSLINPLNACLLYDKKEVDLTMHYTGCVATPNGWTFVVPNNDSVSYGYLYNNTITSKEDATEDFLERFELPEIDGDLTFENYIAKNVCVGERTFLNGNRCAFLEPLEATATGFYQNVCEAIYCTTIGAIPRQSVNSYVRDEMFRLEKFILWHYQFGSKYDTPFWEYAKSLPFNPDDKFNYMVEKSKGMTNLEIDQQYDPKVSELYGQWSYLSFKTWYELTHES